MKRILLAGVGLLAIVGISLAQSSSFGLGTNQKTNFAPRFGFAYDVFGAGRTAVRGGWALFFTRLNTTNYPAAQIPFAETPNLFYGTLSALATSSGLPSL